MKKLALLLAAMTAVSAVASAKEVVAAPVVAVEPVALVCPEPVIVWRPTGYIGAEHRYYAEPEHESIDGQYGRTQIDGKITLTEKDNFWFRARDFQSYASSLNPQSVTSERSRLNMEYNRDLGTIYGDIGVTGIAAYEARKYLDSSANYNQGLAGIRFDFTKYMDWTPELLKNSYTAVEANYRYRVKSESSGDYQNRLGGALYTSWKLPYGFNLDLNGYVYRFYKEGTYAANDDDQTDFEAEWFLTRAFPLYKTESGKTDLTFFFKAGLDTFYNDEAVDGTTQEYFVEPRLRMTHRLNGHTALFVEALGEYRNFENTSTDAMKDWRWRPQAAVGFRTSF